MSDNYVALDLGDDVVRWGLVSPDMVVLEDGWMSWEPSSADEACAVLTALVESKGQGAAGIGVSVAGTVVPDDPHGTVLGAGVLDGAALGAELSFATSLPVTIEGCGMAAALGEHAAGALRNCDLGVALVIGDGVDGGIVSGGRVVRGAHNFAGTFGYMRRTAFEGAFRDEDVMGGSCGWPALKGEILMAKGMLDTGDIDEAALFGWAMHSDVDALRGLHAYAKRLCMWIYDIQCAVDPEVFAICGTVGAHPALMEALQTTMRSMMAELPLRLVPRPNIVAGELGANASLVGVVSEARSRA